jgi:hypothetical protein
MHKRSGTGDYVIVGASTARFVRANPLSADPGVKVLKGKGAAG